MCDLVVAGVDRVHRADAGRYMPVNMKAELVDQRDGFGLARGNVGDLSGVGTFAVGGAIQMSAIARSFVRQSMSR